MIRERYRKYGRIKGSGGEGGKWGLITNSTQTLLVYFTRGIEVPVKQNVSGDF